MNFYAELEISVGASPEEIKRAFHRLAKIHHPDKGGNPEKFKRISRAYAELQKVPTFENFFDQQEVVMEAYGVHIKEIELKDLNMVQREALLRILQHFNEGIGRRMRNPLKEVIMKKIMREFVEAMKNKATPIPTRGN